MNIYDKYFIDIKLNKNTVSVYSVRQALQKSLDKCLSKFNGILLDIGCGEMPYRQYILDKNKKVKKYIGMDVNFNQVHQTVKPNLLWDGKKIPLKNNSINTVIATEFFEHIQNIEDVLKEIKRILKKEGIVYFTVPFIWPLHEVPYDEYRYTPYSLERIFNNTGFKNIQITPLGYHHAALAQMLCIWITNTRGNFSSKIKNIIFNFIEQNILYPFITRLIKMDEYLKINNYQQNTMPTGFYGYATK